MVLLVLDERGKSALEVHRRLHDEYEAEIRKDFSEMSQTEAAFIREVFLKLENPVDHYLKGLE